MGINTEIHTQIFFACNELETTNKKEWLKNNFECYIEMLIWLDRLPPNTRSYIEKDTLKFQFYNLYRDMFKDFEHTLNNYAQSLIFL